MNPGLRSALWIAGSVLVVAALAAPKVLPLITSGEGGKEPAAAVANTARPAGDGGKPEGDGKTKKRSGAKSEGGGPPMKVSSVQVESTRFVETLSSTGTLIAEEAVELQAETSGKVVRIGFAEGSSVRRGELLVKLNDAELRATRERARHRLALAEAREQRIAPLVERGLVTPEEFDAVQAEVQVQKAEIALAEAQIAETEIRAPFDGVVGLRYVSEGAFVNAATRVATLQRLDTLKIDFSVPEIGRAHV
jgi:membrane fusion protein (multidrug efflux system)